MTATDVTIEQVMAGIEDRLKLIPGMRTVPYEPDSVSPPCAFVQLPKEINYDFVFSRACDALRMIVTVMVGRASDRGGAKRMAQHLNPSGEQSIKAAIDGTDGTAQTLGGIVHFARVTKASNVGIQRVADIPYLAADFEVEVKL